MGFPTLPELMTAAILVSGGPTPCTVPKAPEINVKPTTAAIEYDFSKTDLELTAKGSDTISPYGLQAEAITKGLRHDKPQMRSEIKYGAAYDRRYGGVCLWYDTIDVNIHLSPKIYIAKGNEKGKCGQFIMEHEKRHVLVDRQVMNKYARKIGIAIQNAVNSAGAQGPFKENRIDEVRQSMQTHIKSAIDSQMLVMHNEMRQRQAEVDSFEEYEMGAEICGWK